MRRLSKWCGLLLLWPLFAMASESASDAADGGSPAADLAHRLAALQTMAAAFTQLTLAPDGRVLQENEGHLWVASPSRFRIETRAPFAQTLVSDGINFWSFDEDLEQVIIQPLDKDVEQVPILLLGGDSSAVIAAYEVSGYEDELQDYFVLTPRSNATLFETLTIAFRAGVPGAITITDAMGQQTRISFDAARVNQPVDEQEFRFVAPAGVDVIDDRPQD